MADSRIKNLLSYQIRSYMLLQEMNEDSNAYDYAVMNCNEGWETMFKVLYDVFPELKDKISIEEYVYFLLDGIPEIKSEISKDRLDYIFDTAELLAGIALNYFIVMSELYAAVKQ